MTSFLTASQNEIALAPYKKYLEEGTYQGASLNPLQPLPKSRYETFLMAFDLFQEIHGNIIVELGTTRSFVHGGLPGCNLDDPKWWTPQEPKNWDWGAGCFTLMSACVLSPFSKELEIHTVDISKAHIKRCQLMTQEYHPVMHYYITSSEHFLSEFSKKIDLLYMDTGDMTPIEPTALLHLREAQIVIERDLISENGLILIDDVRNGTPRQFGETSEYGKAKYSLPYLLNHGFEILMDEYQVLLRKKTL